MQCHKCGKEINDLWVEVALSTSVMRQREDGINEQVMNSIVHTKENLCTECFEKFCNVIEEGMFEINV